MIIKKTLLIAITAMFVAMGANAQAKKLNGYQKPLSTVEKQVTSPKMSFAPSNVGPMAVSVTKDAVHRAPANIAGTYILDEKNEVRDFISSSTFTVEEATGTIVLNMYDGFVDTGEYSTFKYNVKLIDFTLEGAVAYGFYDEETKEIFIPVQTTIAEMIGSNGTNYGRIVFSSMVLDKEGAALSYGYPMVLQINDDGTVEVEEGDFSEEAEDNPEYEGAYIGGYCNFLPDCEYKNVWNYGFEIEVFIPNATMRDNEVHIENGGWGNWAYVDRPVYVENYDTEYVVHNFFGLCPISIAVDGDKAGIATPVRVMEHNYADEGEQPNYMQIWQWNAEFDEIINPGLITGNITEEDGVKYIRFYETEYKEAWTDENGEHPAGDYYITDYTKWFMVHSTWGDSGAYFWGEARYLYIAIPTIDGAKVELSKTKAIVEKGKTLTLKATVYPDTLEDKGVTWKSSDKKVATVTSAGKVKGVGAGTAIITCTSNATGAKATCKVTVGYVKLDKTETFLEKGKTMALTAKVYPTTEDQSVTWKSSNTTIVTVTSSGKVKGLKVGTAIITCTSNATGLSTICEVIVGYVKLNQTEAILEKGKTLTLKAKVYPTTEDQSVTWKSSNTTIATVTSKGTVNGLKAGTAIITCTSNATGLSSFCEVTVGYVKLNNTEVTIEKGKTLTLKAKVYPTTLDQSVTWKSSDPTIVKVTSNGKIKGLKAGTATITCISNATGLKVTCKVTVGYVKLSKTELTIEKGKIVTLKFKVYPTTEDQNVSWACSDPTIVKVATSGQIKGMKVGTAIITCTSNATGLSATCKVTVVKASSAPSMDGSDDEVTGIEEKTTLAEEFDVYDLNGRRVLNKVTSLDGLSNGVYIINGKKVVIK